MASERGTVVVTGVGARAAAGNHAAELAASVRAGLTRFREWPHLETSDGPLIASFVDRDLGPRPWDEKAPALLRGPIAEALLGAGLLSPALFGAARDGRVCIVLACPDPARPGAARVDLAALAGALASRLLFEDIPVPTEAVGLSETGGAVAVARACALLQEDRADVVLACGADSLLDPAVLSALGEQGRLRAGGLSSGIVPGEAGACAVLELQSSARRRGARALLQVEAVVVDRESQSGPSAPASGRVLARVLQRAASAAGGTGRVTAVIPDVDGERWRAVEWALAEQQLSPLPAGWRRVEPAATLGAVGAAFAPVAVALAAKAHARRWAGGGKVLVAASSAEGTRAAIALAPQEAA